MQTSGLLHKNGGKIVSIDAIAHETYKRVASWHFVGDVEWSDGGKSENTELAPFVLCMEPGDEATRALIENLCKQLSEYLADEGEYHDAKHHSDGRVSYWTPKAKTGKREVKCND